MRNTRSFFAGIFAGLASPSVIASVPDYPKLEGSDSSRIRQDIRRIGEDFNRVIKREHVEAKTSGKRHYQE